MKGFIVAVMNPFITLVTAAEPIDFGRARRNLARRFRWSDAPTPFGARREGGRYRSNPVCGPLLCVVWCHTVQPSIVAPEYGSPPEVAGTPAPGSASMSSLGRWPPLDRWRLCG